MKALAHRTMLILLLLVAVVATASSAQAEPPRRVWPPPMQQLSPPQLGFVYQVIPGYGYRVTNVYWGTPASLVGLEPGDVVRSLNGYPLTYNGAHYYALSQAANNGGWVTLRIRDVRTGWIVTRSLNLFAGGGGGGGGGICR